MLFEHSVPTLVIWLATACGVAAALYSFQRYLGVTLFTILLALLRLSFLALLAWCLFMPQVRRAATRALPPRFLVALDTSQSMSQAAATNAPEPWRVAGAALNGRWPSAIGQQCKIEVYPFAEKLYVPLEPARVKALAPDGPATALRASLNALVDKYKGQDVAGILLLSDGLDTRETDDQWAAQPWPWPIYTLSQALPPRAQAERPLPELKVETVKTARRVTAGWRSELQAVVAGRGTGGRAVNVQLLKDGKLLDEKALWIPDEGGTEQAVFALDHPLAGAFLYTVLLPPFPGELNTNDNQHAVSVQVVEAKNRLLYVEGPPRWESKYLVRALRGNTQLTPACFIQGPGGKFLTVGGQPGMAPDMTAAQLGLFNIVILGNLDAKELGTARGSALVEFVQSGGSLVLLGGSKAWAPSGFSATLLNQVLPVSGAPAAPREGSFRLKLTSEGKTHPAFAGDPEAWQTLPPILSIFPNATLGAGAEPLVSAETAEGVLPVVAVQRYGQGKVVAILTDSLWRWNLEPETGTHQAYRRFWDQLLAWLLPSEEKVGAAEVDVVADKESLYLGDAIEIGAKLSNAEWGDLDGVIATCTIAAAGRPGVPFAMTRRSLQTQSGRAFPGFAVTVTAEKPGLHTAVVSFKREEAVLESAPISFFVESFTPESVPKPPNVNVLKEIARGSGGAFFDNPSELDRALCALKLQGREEATILYKSLWRNALVIVCLLALVSVEWVLRKLRNRP